MFPPYHGNSRLSSHPIPENLLRKNLRKRRGGCPRKDAKRREKGRREKLVCGQEASGAAGLEHVEWATLSRSKGAKRREKRKAVKTARRWMVSSVLFRVFENPAVATRAVPLDFRSRNSDTNFTNFHEPGMSAIPGLNSCQLVRFVSLPFPQSSFPFPNAVAAKPPDIVSYEPKTFRAVSSGSCWSTRFSVRRFRGRRRRGCWLLNAAWFLARAVGSDLRADRGVEPEILGLPWRLGSADEQA
jgi:hypothetical protein